MRENYLLSWFPIWRRHFLVWYKLLIPSLLGNFGEPLLYLLALGYGLGQFVGNVNGLPYITFIASGIVCSSAMNVATFEGLYSAFTRMTTQLTWDGMLATPLGVNDIIAGETFWAATKSLINSTAIILVAVALNLVHSWQTLWVLPIVFLIGTCFCCIALAITTLAKSYDFFLYYLTLIITPVMLLSGVFFPINNMPHAIQIGAKMLPLYHAVVLVRPLMTGQTVSAIGLHLSVIIGYTVVAYGIAVKLAKRRLLI